jgi:hypothetical protein
LIRSVTAPSWVTTATPVQVRLRSSPMTFTRAAGG